MMNIDDPGTAQQRRNMMVELFTAIVLLRQRSRSAGVIELMSELNSIMAHDTFLKLVIDDRTTPLLLMDLTNLLDNCYNIIVFEGMAPLNICDIKQQLRYIIDRNTLGQSDNVKSLLEDAYKLSDSPIDNTNAFCIEFLEKILAATKIILDEEMSIGDGDPTLFRKSYDEIAELVAKLKDSTARELIEKKRKAYDDLMADACAKIDKAKSAG